MRRFGRRSQLLVALLLAVVDRSSCDHVEQAANAEKGGGDRVVGDLASTRVNQDANDLPFDDTVYYKVKWPLGEELAAKHVTNADGTVTVRRLRR